MKSEIEAKIEYQTVIGDAKPGYSPIRFTRIKYKASPETHIDIRRFQRGSDENGEDKLYPTKTGFQFLEREFKKVVKKYAVMPESYIHPKILKKSFSLLEGKHFESAVLQAFKLIETTIREKIDANPEIVGVKLIRNAFNPEKGPLTNFNLLKAEREAFCHYMAGAFGYYKNPCSHRDVDMDFLTAFGRIVVASDLLKAVDQAGVN